MNLPFRLSTAVAIVACLLELRPLSAQPPAAPVVVAPVTRLTVNAGQAYVGTVLPRKRAVVGSAVDGRLVELFVEEGDKVDAKGSLAQLLTDTIKLELKGAQGELQLRRAELEELENGSRPEEIDEAKSQMLSARAMMEFTAARRDRNQRLNLQNRTISMDELQETVAAAEAASQDYHKNKATYELVVQGPRPERIAQARFRVAIQEALVEQIEDRIKKHTIISRFEGYVVDKLAEQGQWLDRGDPVAEIVALGEVDVEVYVVEQHIRFVKLRSSVRVEAPALPSEVFVGYVSAVVPQADVRTRTFPVKIRVENRLGDDQLLLKPGMYARVTLPTGDQTPGLVVPKDALVLGGATPVVYVVNGTGRGASVSPVAVELGVAVNDLIQVTGALEPGQRVVVEGNERLRPGQAVQIIRELEPGTADPRSEETTP